MDQATAARHRLEAVEVRTRSLCRVATPRCRPGSGGTDRRQPTWPLATRKQPRAHHRAANDLSQITRPSFHRRTAACLIRRTAAYGPVCPLVSQGRSRKISPYPDCLDQAGFKRAIEVAQAQALDFLDITVLRHEHSGDP